MVQHTLSALREVSQIAHDNRNLLDLIKKLPGLITGFIAFIAAVVGFVKLWQGDTGLVTIVLRKRSHGDIETVFKDAKQWAGFAACQCRVPEAMGRHVTFVLLTYVALNQIKLDPSETAGEVKERLQLHAFSGGTLPPAP